MWNEVRNRSAMAANDDGRPRVDGTQVLGKPVLQHTDRHHAVAGARGPLLQSHGYSVAALRPQGQRAAAVKDARARSSPRPGTLATGISLRYGVPHREAHAVPTAGSPPSCASASRRELIKFPGSRHGIQTTLDEREIKPVPVSASIMTPRLFPVSR
jgi:hypothetical protein